MFIVAGEAGMSSRKRPSRDQELRTCLRCMAYASRVCVSLGKGWAFFLQRALRACPCKVLTTPPNMGCAKTCASWPVC